ncbi:MAG TPA: type II toxin-antitoxin system HicA family toxin [Planctomycetes bacterium]|nr:type II toxin-antitoxin system HicA family toxin [Planctomycetota bacterium]
MQQPLVDSGNSQQYTTQGLIAGQEHFMDDQKLIQFLERENALRVNESPYPTEVGEEDVVIEIPKQILLPTKKTTGQFLEKLDPQHEELLELIREIKKRINHGNDYIRTHEDSGHEDVQSLEWDVCAWYQPIHYYGHSWGIYMRQDCIIRQTWQLLRRVHHDFFKEGPPWEQLGRLLIASATLYFLHEHYHHKVECFGFRMHVALHKSVYLPYKEHIYRKYFGSDLCLEEALANADSFRRLRDQPYKDTLGSHLRTACENYLHAQFRCASPGYRRAQDFLKRHPSGKIEFLEADFLAKENELQATMQECLVTPTGVCDDWGIASHMMRSKFTHASNIKFIVPPGRRPIYRSGLSLAFSCSTIQMKKLYTRQGYVEDSAGGKGSHTKYRKGDHVQIIPEHKTLPKGLAKKLLKALDAGYKLEDLPRLVRGK